MYNFYVINNEIISHKTNEIVLIFNNVDDTRGNLGNQTSKTKQNQNHRCREKRWLPEGRVGRAGEKGKEG